MLKGFRQRLKNGERLLGTMVTLPTASTAEILADAGFDWLFVDCEHGSLSTADVMGILQTVGHRIACIVRVPVRDEGEIKRILDVGAQGIIVPQVNTAEEAAEVVRFCRYPPIGGRGVGLGRAQGYGFQFPEYVASANDDVVVIVQAEHKLAVDNIQSIVQVPGIDCVLLGPYDLAASYGKMGLISDPEVLAGIDRITSTCRTAGLPLGYFGVNGEALAPYAAQGYSLLISGVDVLFLGQGARKAMKELQAM